MNMTNLISFRTKKNIADYFQPVKFDKSFKRIKQGR